jgi:hypothetical protein
MSSSDEADTVNVNLDSGDEDAILRTPGRDMDCDPDPELPSTTSGSSEFLEFLVILEILEQKVDQLSANFLHFARAQAAHNHHQEGFNNTLRLAINHIQTVLQSLLDHGLSAPAMGQLLKELRDKIIRAFRNASCVKGKALNTEANPLFLPKNFWGDDEDKDDQGESLYLIFRVFLIVYN